MSTLPFKVIYSDGYYLPIGVHVFPAEKYRLIRTRLLEAGVADAADFLEPQPAADDDIRLVHSESYVHKLLTGTLSTAEVQLMELPYSKQLVEAFWLAAGGSILAADCALRDGVAFNIGGGFHHAFPDYGEGFCMIHDVAVAIRRMQKDGKISRAMTVDCDVHHGNGTAAIFPPQRFSSQPSVLPSMSPVTKGAPHASRAERRDSRTRIASDVEREQNAREQNRKMAEASEQTVFTISLHQHNNYPMVKPPSAIDVNLPDGTTDEEYLHWLDNALSSALRQFTPELICYIAGADPYVQDQLGGLSLSIDGLKQRDLLVFKVAKARGIPVMVTYAGGYARQVEDTVTIHCNTVIAAKEIFAR